MKELLKNEAPHAEVEAQLAKCADKRIKMQVSAYKTALQMKEILDEEQRGKVENLMENDREYRMKKMRNN